MKSRLIFAFCIALFCGQIGFAQTESTLKVINDVNKQAEGKSRVELVALIEQNSDSFDFNDDVDKILYNWIIGSLWYNEEQYMKAKPFLVKVIEFLDENIDDESVFTPANNMLLFYYWVALCDFHTGQNKDLVQKELLRAKEIYEYSNAKETDTYQSVIADLQYIDEGLMEILPVLSSALQNTFKGDYMAAIPQYEYVIQETLASYPFSTVAEYIQGH